MPKKYKNLYQLICTKNNIELADEKASRNKKNSYGVIKHIEHREENIKNLLDTLQKGEYKTSEYTTYKIYEPKERLIYRLPYYPDRIVHHAIMNVMEPLWKKIFIKQTYSSISGRGIHACAQDVKKALREDVKHTTYCLKLDIRKFYPSINHKILKHIIRKKIADAKLLKLLDEIIDSAPGVPIGNYLSQFFANLYLSYFDHWVKEEWGIKYYFRYADDIVILHENKKFLHLLLRVIKCYLKAHLDLNVKDNWQVFPVDARGIDFVGYKFYHTHTLLRKDIKRHAMKVITDYQKDRINKQQFYDRFKSYYGWLKYCSSKHILRRVQDFTGLHYSNFVGELVGISQFTKPTNIDVIDVSIKHKYFLIHFIWKNKPYTIKSRSRKLLRNIISKASKDDIQKWGIDYLATHRKSS